MTTDTGRLTVLQWRWLAFYLHGEYPNRYNAKQSAIAAGYSPQSAHELGSRCLNNPKIRRLIDAYLDELMNGNGTRRS